MRLTTVCKFGYSSFNLFIIVLKDLNLSNCLIALNNLFVNQQGGIKNSTIVPHSHGLKNNFLVQRGLPRNVIETRLV